MQNNQIHPSWQQTWMSQVESRWLIRPYYCFSLLMGSDLRLSHPWVDFWTGLQGREQRSSGSRGSYKQECLCEVTSYCTAKWQKVLLANGSTDLNIHFEVGTRKQPSRHLQRECLSPQVSCWTFTTSAPYWQRAIWLLQVCGEESKMRSHSCGRRRRFRRPRLRAHLFIIHARIKICILQVEDSKTCGTVSIRVFCIGTPQELKEKWGNGGKLHLDKRSKKCINQHPGTTVSVKRIYAGGKE